MNRNSYVSNLIFFLLSIYSRMPNNRGGTLPFLAFPPSKFHLLGPLCMRVDSGQNSSIGGRSDSSMRWFIESSSPRGSSMSWWFCHTTASSDCNIGKSRTWGIVTSKLRHVEVSMIIPRLFEEVMIIPQLCLIQTGVRIHARNTNIYLVETRKFERSRIPIYC